MNRTCRGQKTIVAIWGVNAVVDGLALAHELARRAEHCCLSSHIVVCPPATLLTILEPVFADTGIHLGGQDCHQAMGGPHTGEISAEMLRDAGCTHVIVGHSERRYGCGETDDQVNAKVSAAWRAGLAPIPCVAETGQHCEQSERLARTEAQLRASMPPDNPSGKLIIAYEPVRAIGAGVTLAGARITRAHRVIRAAIPAAAPVLYGGLINPRNANEILGLDEVDGVLVRGASVDARNFWAIVEACPTGSNGSQTHMP